LTEIFSPVLEKYQPARIWKSESCGSHSFSSMLKFPPIFFLPLLTPMDSAA